MSEIVGRGGLGGNFGLDKSLGDVTFTYVFPTIL